MWWLIITICSVTIEAILRIICLDSSLMQHCSFRRNKNLQRKEIIKFKSSDKGKHVKLPNLAKIYNNF